MNTKFLDLDAIQPETIYTLKLNGKEHEMHEPSLGGYIESLQKIESMGLDATPTQELELTIEMILRAFPTLTRKDLEKLTISQVRQIGDYTLQASGQAEKAEDKDGESKEGNAPASG